MVHSCSAYNCVERDKRGSSISFHKFPRDPILRKKWIIAMRREHFKPSKWTTVCSKHFTPDSYITSPWSSVRRLKNDAVPSTFDFPSHLTKKNTTRKPPAPRIISENVEVENEDMTEKQNIATTATNEETSIESHVEPPVKKKRLFYAGDFNEHSSSRNVQQYRLTVNNVLKKKQKQIKIVQQRNRRLVKKVSNLKSLLHHLKQQRIIDDDDCSLKLSITTDGPPDITWEAEKVTAVCLPELEPDIESADATSDPVCTSGSKDGTALETITSGSSTVDQMTSKQTYCTKCSVTLPTKAAVQQPHSSDDAEAALLRLRVDKLLLEMEKLCEERQLIAAERQNMTLRADISALNLRLQTLITNPNVVCSVVHRNSASEIVSNVHEGRAVHSVSIASPSILKQQLTSSAMSYRSSESSIPETSNKSMSDHSLSCDKRGLSSAGKEKESVENSSVADKVSSQLVPPGDHSRSVGLVTAGGGPVSHLYGRVTVPVSQQSGVSVSTPQTHCLLLVPPLTTSGTPQMFLTLNPNSPNVLIPPDTRAPQVLPVNESSLRASVNTTPGIERIVCDEPVESLEIDNRKQTSCKSMLSDWSSDADGKFSNDNRQDAVSNSDVVNQNREDINGQDSYLVTTEDIKCELDITEEIDHEPQCSYSISAQDVVKRKPDNTPTESKRRRTHSGDDM